MGGLVLSEEWKGSVGEKMRKMGGGVGVGTEVGL